MPPQLESARSPFPLDGGPVSVRLVRPPAWKGLPINSPSRPVVVALVGVAALLVLSSQDAAAEPDASPARLAGPDRVSTAAEVAEEVFAPEGGTSAETTTALVARADAFPDALASAGLAGAIDAPVLLTHPDRLSPRTRDALSRLGVDNVILLGGEDAISPAVAEEAEAGYTTDRLAGPDRYATAADLARAAAQHGSDGGTPETVIVVRGDTFADALTAGPAAFAEGNPVLLTHRDRLADATKTVLDELTPSRALILGGTAAVDDGPVTALRDRGVSVERIAGGDRAATAAAMADHLAAGGWPADRAVLARGDDFADALTASSLAGRARAPILLARSPTALGEAATGWLAERCPGVGRVRAVGGSVALAPKVLDDAHQATLDCRPLEEPVTFGYQAAAAADTGAPGLVDVVADTLERPEGWALDGALRFRAVGENPDLVFRLVPPETVEAADPRCHADASCRVDDEVWLNADRWRVPPSSWDGTVDDYRRYLVNHTVGHWLGLGHSDCRADGAAVMIDEAEGPECAPTAWPGSGERARVRQRHLAPVSVAFAGDVHGEGRVAEHLRAGLNPLEEIAPVLSAADAALVNLETAVGAGGTPQPGKEFTFQAPPALLSALGNGGVDVVSLANNHALDYGTQGLSETLQHAGDAGLRAVGAGPDASAAYESAVLELGRRRVAVVGLSRVLPPGWAAEIGRAGLASAYQVAAAEQAVQAAAERATHVVATVHWGEELAACPVDHQRDLARRLTAAGADVVAGHHPHILQGVERIDDALVHYSLGNFVWYHSREPSRYTGVWTVELGGRRPESRFTAAEIDERGRPVPASGALAHRINADLDARSPGGGRCAS